MLASTSTTAERRQRPGRAARGGSSAWSPPAASALSTLSSSLRADPGSVAQALGSAASLSSATVVTPSSFQIRAPSSARGPAGA